MFADDETLANAQMFKIDGRGIEDVFDVADFKKFVLDQQDVAYEGCNSQYVKDAHRSKIILAYQFWIKVADGQIKLKKLSDQTQANITTLVGEITSRLNPKA